MILKQKYNSKDHKIYLGSILNLYKEIQNKSIDLVFADPPYNMGKNFGNNKDKWKTLDDYVQWSKEWINIIKSKLKDNGSFIMMGHPHYSAYLVPYLDSQFTYVNQIIYHYTDGMPEKKNFEKRYEVILYYRNNPTKYHFDIEDVRSPLVRYEKYSNTKGKNPGDVWQINRLRWNSKERVKDNNKIFHASQKPLRLLRRIILATTKKNSIVLDPFLGTGTTSVACKELGRKSIGIEINNEYILKAINRLKETEFKKEKFSYEQR
ncbi:DNA-methyltransferase [Candidatus Pelagibacter sp. HIMB1623]|uniref:DNA-methyltransferase n=1 Tax=Candidatus Pelagibacter sp. HIMB1623 TaxID=3413358 RepID=UPI003F828C0C